MTAERWCPRHCIPLLDLVCAYQHGTSWDVKAGRRVPNFEVDCWLLVIDGVVAAECDVNGRNRWLRQPFEGVRQLAGRNPDGTGGRPWALDMQQERRP